MHAKDFSNQLALQEKVNLLKDINSSEQASLLGRYKFHGLLINFFGRPRDKALLDYLPSTWRLEEVTSNLTHIDVEFNGEWKEDWELEVNPDCYFLVGETEKVVQRDFFCSKINKRYVVCLNDQHGDGTFNFLRWLLPRKISHLGHFLVHSSTVVKEGKAYVFLGHSGAGKSTIAKLSEDQMVLGDDMNILNFKEGVVFAKAGGLGGLSFDSTDFDREYPVKSFFWLKQGTETYVEKKSKSFGATKLLASFANLFWNDMSDDDKDFYLTKALEMSSAVPFYELSFVKNKEFWDVI